MHPWQERLRRNVESCLSAAARQSTEAAGRCRNLRRAALSGLAAALGAAMAWTGASALWRSLSGSGTALELNGLKNGLATILFLPVLITVPWGDQASAVLLLLLSGLAGIAAGDSFYLGALRRIGTRRTLTVEATNPVLASIGGVLFMGDSISATDWLGAGVVALAVTLIAGHSGTNDVVSGRASGIALALLSVICGLCGAFLAREVLITSMLSPLQTASIRLIGGWIGLLPLLRRNVMKRRLSRQMMVKVVLATVLGTNLGIALQQMVFSSMPVGQGVTLMSTAPVMALLVGRLEGDPIQPRGVMAAVLAVAGVALISL